MQPININTNNLINQPKKFFGTTLNSNIASKRSLLILISPRKHYEVSLRSLQYNFHVGVVDTIETQLQRGESALLNKSLHRQLANETIIPSPNPIIMDIAKDYWTFCFIIEHKNMYNYLQLAPVKSVITGYCNDEPIFTQNGKQVYNPKCQLIPTHMLQITTLMQTIGPQNIEVNKITSTVDIINYIENVTNQILPINDSANAINQPLYVNSPDVIIKMVDQESIYQSPDTSNSVIVTPPPQGSIQDQLTVKLNSEVNKPIKHIENIMNSISSAIIDIQEPYAIPYAVKDRVVDALNNTNVSKPVNNLAVENMAGQLYMEYIVTNFNPEISVVQVPQHQMLDVVDPSLVTPNVIYSNLLAQLIPLYMIKYNLSCVAFSYDSFTDSFNPELMHMEFITVETPEVMKQKIDKFLIELKLDVLEIPKKYGDFILNVMVNQIGDAFVDLQFYDLMHSNGYFAQDMVFRPYGDTSIGTFDTIANNATNLDALITNLSSILSGSI